MGDLTLQSVKILRDGRSMPLLGLGTYLGEADAVKTALELGYRLIDTASLYDNEEEVGKQIKKSSVPRKDIFVVTKVWNTEHGRQATIQSLKDSLKSQPWILIRQPGKRHFAKQEKGIETIALVRARVLKKHEISEVLDMEYVDLFLMHSAGGGKVLETWDTMIELRDQGLAKSIGVANFNVQHLKHLKEARPDQLPAVNQIEIHPFLAWDKCVSYCQQEDIAVMAYSPLAKAMKLRTPSLTQVAETYGKSPAQIMIRWSLQRGFICVPKSSNRARIAQNADIFCFRISDEDMQKLNGLDEQFISDWPGIMMTPWEP